MNKIELLKHFVKTMHPKLTKNIIDEMAGDMLNLKSITKMLTGMVSGL